MKIGVLGAGSFGTVITDLLLRNKNSVLLWGRNESILSSISKDKENPKYLPGFKLCASPEVTTDISRVASECEIVFLSVPARSVREVLRVYGDYVGCEQIMISTVKGLEYESFKRMSEIIKEETPIKKIGVLSGPNLAKEIAEGVPSATVIASYFEEVIKDVHSLLNQKLFRVYGNYDPVGVEYCGAFKNIYAIASGIAKGLSFGLNARSFLLTKALKEMRELSVLFGAKEQTFQGLSGVGDLIATSMSEASRNFRFGFYLAGGKSAEDALKMVNQTVEGYYTLRACHDFFKTKNLYAPIVEAVYSIVYENKQIKDVLEALLEPRTILEHESHVQIL